MKKEAVMFLPPPRLLLGVTFLFWGAMHDRPLPALAAAVLVEGRHWTNLRWSFGEMRFARSWQLSVLILIVAAIGLFQIEDRAAADFLNLLSWLPFMMLPLALAQQYCADRGVPLTTFSFIARRKILADRKAGRAVNVRDVHLGYPYFFLVLIVAGMGVGNVLRPGIDEIHYSVGVVGLLGWGLFKMGGGRRCPGAWGVAYGVSILMALGMTWGAVSAYGHFIKSLMRPSEQSGTPFETKTSIGQVHQLQLSPTLLWRYYHQDGRVPDLLRISSYNWPEGDLWRARMRSRAHRERIPVEREVGGDFEKFLTVGEDAFLFHQEDRGLEKFGSRGEIVGMVSDQSLVPHPLRTKRLEEVRTEILSANSMGAIQLNGPRQAAMRMRLFSDDGLEAVEHDPSEMDLRCPSREEPGLDRFLGEIGLNAISWKSKRAKGKRVTEGNASPPDDVSMGEFLKTRSLVGGAFRADFTYSLFLTGADLSQPMSEFVNVKKEGHCEYFAGATTLLLRRMGIPARYVVGFVVREEGADDGEYLIRGKHAHAWSQAYVGGTWIDESRGEPNGEFPRWRCRGGKWVDVDLTPPDWLSANDENRWFQVFSDWFQKAKANLVLWFAAPAVVKRFKLMLFLVGCSFLIYLIYKLMKNRGRVGRGLPGSWEEKLRQQGDLRDFERWLARRVGPRPVSLPMASWLRAHLPEGGAELVSSYEAATFNPGEMGATELGEKMKAAKVLWKEAQKTPSLGKARGSFK